MCSGPLPESLTERLPEYVEPFVAAINFIPPEDSRDPPGDHWGTGWLLDAFGAPYLITCKHVARRQAGGTLGYNCYGAEFGISVGGRFELFPALDVAIASIAATYRCLAHKGQCTQKQHYADSHLPVKGEYFYAYGFPGADAKAGFGQHEVRGMGVFLQETGLHPSILAQMPVSIVGSHLSFAWSPEAAERLDGTSGTLSPPHGMSGSPLWNTRYVEVTQQGKTWEPSDSRITGIVWGHSSKACCLLATAVEDFIDLLFPKKSLFEKA